MLLQGIIRADICHIGTLLRMNGANVFVIFSGTRASSRCSKELGERLFKHAWLKVFAYSPLVHIISARLLAALYMPLMSYTMPRRRTTRTSLLAKERSIIMAFLWERSCAWKICVSRIDMSESNTTLPIPLLRKHACDFADGEF